jgi:hypothetical protein
LVIKVRWVGREFVLLSSVRPDKVQCCTVPYHTCCTVHSDGTAMGRIVFRQKYRYIVVVRGYSTEERYPAGLCQGVRVGYKVGRQSIWWYLGS